MTGQPDHIWAFVLFLGMHWVGDFVLQSHWMSINKSKRSDVLALHVAIYTATIGTAAAVMFNDPFLVPPFIATNGVLHFATDYVTSRITSRLWQEKRIHEFFVVIGLDQFIHQMTLAFTLWWFFLGV